MALRFPVEMIFGIGSTFFQFQQNKYYISEGGKLDTLMKETPRRSEYYKIEEIRDPEDVKKTQPVIWKMYLQLYGPVAIVQPTPDHGVFQETWNDT